MLKRTGLVKPSLTQPIGRAAVPFGPPNTAVEGKLLSNLMKRKPKALTNKNQTNQQRKARAANRRLQLNKEFEVRPRLKEQAKQKFTTTRIFQHNQQKTASFNSSQLRQDFSVHKTN